MKKIKDIFKDNSNKISKIDWIIMIILMVLYGCLSFYRLGDLQTPESYYTFKKIGDHNLVQFGDTVNIAKIKYYSGNKTGGFRLLTSQEKKDHEDDISIFTTNVFSWGEFRINLTTNYIDFVSEEDNITLGEVVFYDKSGNIIKPIMDKNNPLLDEVNTVPLENSYLNNTYFDEIFYARSAYEYAHGLDAYEWTHPPLGKIIMAIPIRLFGFSPFNYRFMGNLAGIFMISLMYILAKKIFKNRKWALLAALLMMFDNFHFAHTRIALIDSFQIVFILVSIIFMKNYLDCKENASFNKISINLLLSGIFIGCAISTKWNAIYIGIGLAIIFFIDLLKSRKKKNNLFKLFILCVISFIVIPLAIYILSYLLFPNVDGYDGTLLGIINQTKRMLTFHSNTEMTHSYSSKWYTWPIMYRPISLYSSLSIDGMRSVIVDIGNPAIWWFGIPSIIYLFISVIKKRDYDYLLILILILSSYLPYIFVNRIMFMYHYFITLPFVFLAIVSLIKWITEKLKTNKVYYLYIIVVIISFIMFYPIVSGMNVKEEYITFTKWLSSWDY